MNPSVFTSKYGPIGTIPSTIGGNTNYGASVTNRDTQPAMLFNTNDYINVGNTLNFGTSSFTFEVMFNTDYIPSGVTSIQDKLNRTGANTGYALIWVNSDLTAFLGSSANGGDSLNPPFTGVQASKWHTATAVVDRSTNDLILYLDGEHVSTTDISGVASVTTNESFRIGADSNLSYWDGAACELRVWNYARTQQETKDDMFRRISPNRNGLVGYWPMR